MKKQCVLKNLRSEKGYKLSIDVNQNLINNIRVWCMNSKDKMAYYLAPEVVNSINRDVWPKDLVIHAVYYYLGIKHDISEKIVLEIILPDLNNIVLGIECNGYIPNGLSNSSINEAPLLLSDGIIHDSAADGADVFEEPSDYFFYDEDPDFFDAMEKHHTVEPVKNIQNSKPDRNAYSYGNRKHSDTNPAVDKSKKVSSDYSTEQKKDDSSPIGGMSQDGYSEECSAGRKNTNDKEKSNKRLAFIGIIAGIIVALIIMLLTSRTPDNKGADQGNDSQVSDVDFKSLLSQETAEDIRNIYINDFDGNGKAEAFVTTIDSDDFDSDNLWYISEQGAVLVDEAGMVPQLLVTESGEILVPWRVRYGATLCYGLYHGQVKPLDIYKANIFQKKEKGTIYAVEEYFTANGEYHKNIVCEFDATAFELILTDDFYESNPTEDMDFCWNRETPEVSDYQESDIVAQREISRTGDGSFKESDLYQTAISSIPGTIQEWCYEDFDGDGNKEAFVSTGDDDTYFAEDGEKSLWYLSDTGNIECIFDNEAYWHFSHILFVFSDYKLFYIDATHGYYAVLGVKNDTPVEVSMPENTYYYWISQDSESGIITAADKREERAHVLEYDSSAMTFVDTGKTVLNE